MKSESHTPHMMHNNKDGAKHRHGSHVSCTVVQLEVQPGNQWEPQTHNAIQRRHHQNSGSHTFATVDTKWAGLLDSTHTGKKQHSINRDDKLIFHLYIFFYHFQPRLCQSWYMSDAWSQKIASGEKFWKVTSDAWFWNVASDVKNIWFQNIASDACHNISKSENCVWQKILKCCIWRLILKCCIWHVISKHCIWRPPDASQTQLLWRLIDVTFRNKASGARIKNHFTFTLNRFLLLATISWIKYI